MDKSEITIYLNELNNRLKEQNIKGQIALFGGTVMCLSYNARPITKDIDAMFEPKQIINKIAKQIANENKLPENWLNDSVKGFVSQNSDMKVFKNLSNLIIYVPSEEYMLAMKCMSARLEEESQDRNDIDFLIDRLNLKNLESIIEIVLKYYPPDSIQPKMQYLLEELLEENKNKSKAKNELEKL